MYNPFYQNLKDDNVLKYISVLSVLEQNSSFCHRLAIAQMAAYAMWKRDDIDWCELESILKKGEPQWEDPQEVLFIETLNTPFDSYRVFSSFLLTHKYNLSQLLYLSHRINFPQKKLSIVYALLTISDIIAQRFGYQRYVIGKLDHNEIYHLSLNDYNTIKNYTTFTKTELGNILENYDLTVANLAPLMLKVEAQVIQNEHASHGYSDAFEMHPFLELKDGTYLITFPSSLLRAAYMCCYGIMQNEIGKTQLLDLVESEMVQETGAVLHASLAHYVSQSVFDKIPFLWFEFDIDKIANVAIVLVDKKPDLETAIVNAETAINLQYPTKKVFTIIVTQQMSESDSIFLCYSKPITHFNVEDLKIAMSQRDMNLLNLYYYDEDKKGIPFFSGNQEIDLFSLYRDNGGTFYRDEMPDTLWVEIGYALKMRADYLCVNDEHVVGYIPQKAKVLVHHFADIPKQVPIYAPYMTEEGINMLQLSNHELWMHVNTTNEYKVLCREFVIAAFNWIYAAQHVKSISPLLKSTHVEVFFIPGKDFDSGKANESVMVFCIPEEIVKEDEASLERNMVMPFVNALCSNGFGSSDLTLELVEQMMSEASCGFMQIAREDDTSIIDVNDGVNSCYYVNKRCCDVILSEIAECLNIKGKGCSFGFSDSRQILIRVSEYILGEIQKLLKTFDTKLLLRSLLDLHHSMIYWSKLTQKRFRSLSLAYSYINATFDNQMEYANDYSEMNTLSQGLIETIILNDIHNDGGEIGIELIDRLFALMHFNLNMGSYLDQLGERIPGSELSILPNGRLVMPRVLIDKQNNYFMRLRKLGMLHPELYVKLSTLLPSLSIDINDQLFLSAFKAEYELDFEKYAGIIMASIDYAMDNKQPVMVMPEADFYNMVAKDVLEDADIMAFKKSFVLQSSIQKEGLDFSDKWLQRFNRPVQVTARPWILYDGCIYYSTKTIYESWIIKTERLHNGTISKHSKEMRLFVARVNVKKGHEFSTNIRKYYESLKIAGLFIDSEVNIHPNKPLSSSDPLGDIDILLINKNTKQIVCIEAKNYAESRTAYELIQQNKKIVTKELPHVVSRDKWCKENKDKFRFYVPEVNDTYIVKTIFLTYHENAYNYFEHEEDYGLTFLSAMDIIENPMVVFE